MIKIAFPSYSSLRSFVHKNGPIFKFFSRDINDVKLDAEVGQQQPLDGYVDEVTFDEKFQVA